MRVLALVPDAFGGHGGIARYTRDMIEALSSSPSGPSIVVLPRQVTRPVEKLPRNVTFLDEARGSKTRYLFLLTKLLLKDRHFDLIVCSHLHLMSMADIARRMSGAPLILFTYGIEAWAPSGHPFANRALKHASAVVSIRQLTLDRLTMWADLGSARTFVLENSVRPDEFSPGPKEEALLDKWDLGDKEILMTMGRMIPAEKFKGTDEILETLPALRRDRPSLRFVVVGGGEDIPRLKEKARTLGVDDIVVFTGFVDESDVVAYHRLADTFAMPGTASNFDRYPLRFVFLEAMACGVPVVASVPDEETDAEGHELRSIRVVPEDHGSIKKGIEVGLERGRGNPPAGLERYAFESYERRLHDIIDKVIGTR